MTYTAIIKNEGTQWLGWTEELPGVNCQEYSYETLLETLRITSKEAIEFNRQEALDLAGVGYKEQAITV